MHLEMFDHHIVHAECLGGDIDLLLNRRAVIGAFPWRLVDGESCICRILAFVPEKEHADLMKKKQKARLTNWGDIAGIANPWLHKEARARAKKNRARRK
jgi:arylformamidase